MTSPVWQAIQCDRATELTDTQVDEAIEQSKDLCSYLRTMGYHNRDVLSSVRYKREELLKIKADREAPKRPALGGQTSQIRIMFCDDGGVKFFVPGGDVWRTDTSGTTANLSQAITYVYEQSKKV